MNLLDSMLDHSNILDLPPSVVLYGAPGLGKTTEMARAFQGVLYVQSSPSILHAYADWVAKHPELKLTIPKRITFDENHVRLNGGSWTNCLVTIMREYLAGCDAGTSPYTGIVFDEWNVICENIFAELKSDPWGKFKGRNGNLNIFAVFDAFKLIHRSALSLSRRSRKMAGFVAHYQLPKIDDDDASPTKGSIKWRGGPKMPMGLSDQTVALCADADVVLQLEIKEAKKAFSLLDLPTPGVTTPAPAPATPAAPQVQTLDLSSLGATPATPAAAPAAAPAQAAPAPAKAEVGERVFYTQLDTKWFRKVRGFGVEAEEPLDIHGGKGLRELLKRAGYPV